MEMKHFEQAIADYLNGYVDKDGVFAGKYHMGEKTIQGCVRYIMRELETKARKMEKVGNCVPMVLSDQEVFGMAVHYFDEDSIKECKEEPKAKVQVATPKKAEKPAEQPKMTIVKGKKDEKKDDDILEGQLSLF